MTQLFNTKEEEEEEAEEEEFTNHLLVQTTDVFRQCADDCVFIRIMRPG